MGRQILVVDSDRAALDAMAAALATAGYEATLADDFDEASALLKSHPFEVLLTAHRLGTYNGLHLVLRARAERPEVGAIVSTAKEDSVLEAEADAFAALCVTAPWTYPGELLSVLARLDPLPRS